MRKYSTGNNYVLGLKDDLSGYVWLMMAIKCESMIVSTAIQNWICTFTVVDFWVSDQGSHFKNQFVHELSTKLKINHHFVVAYSPWANGTVERVVREIRRAATALLSEFRLAPHDGESIIRLIQRIINESPVKRLGKNEDGTRSSPLQVMTGLRPSRNDFTFEMQKEAGVSEKWML